MEALPHGSVNVFLDRLSARLSNSRYFPLLLLAMAHAIVDAFAIIAEPLWPQFRQNFELTSLELFWLLSIGAVMPSFSQIVFGYLRDRQRARYVVWLGPLFSALCLSMIGVASSVTALGVLLILGYIAVGAFHPESAVIAGRLIPERRARCLAIFMFGGTLGLGFGPMISGNLVRWFGMQSLAFLVIPAVLLVIAFRVALGRINLHEQVTPAAHSLTLKEMMQGRGHWVAYLLLVTGLRTVPSVGMGKAIAFTLAGRGYEEHIIGNTQSVFLLAGGAGMLLMAARFQQGWERRFLIVCPLFGVLPLVGMGIPGCPLWLLVVLLVPAGVILNGTAPAMVSYSHQLLPKGAGMASAMTMGVSWGVGGLIVSGMTSYFEHSGHPELLFVAFIPCAVLSGFAAIFLPDPFTMRQPDAIESTDVQPQTAEA